MENMLKTIINARRIEMKIIHSLIVLSVLCVGSMVFGEEKVLFDGKQDWDNADITADPENDGNKVMTWFRDTICSRDLVAVDMDWSKYTALNFKMYVAEADGHEICVTCLSNPKGGENNYYLKKIKIDWKGWKTITIPFSEFSVIRNVAGWSRINSITMFAKGFGCERTPGAKYYIDDVKLVDGAEKAESGNEK